ncbi:MAG: hypothetical protein ABIQ01_01755 [Pseudolysinimonas sp.]
MATLGLFPLLVSALDATSSPTTYMTPWPARVGISLIIITILGGTDAVWRSLIKVAPDLHSLIVSRIERSRLTLGVMSCYGPSGRQLWRALAAASAACGLLLTARLSPEPIAIAFSDFVVLFCLAFVATNGLYWCWRFAQFAGWVAMANLTFGLGDPRKEFAVGRVMALLRAAIVVVSVELCAAGLVIWQLPVSPHNLPGAHLGLAGLLVLELLGLAMMVALLVSFGRALLLLSRRVSDEVDARILVLRSDRDAIPALTRSKALRKERRRIEKRLEALRRPTHTAGADRALAFLGPIVPLVLQGAQLAISLALPVTR